MDGPGLEMAPNMWHGCAIVSVLGGSVTEGLRMGACVCGRRGLCAHGRLEHRNVGTLLCATEGRRIRSERFCCGVHDGREGRVPMGGLNAKMWGKKGLCAHGMLEHIGVGRLLCATGRRRSRNERGSWRRAACMIA